LVAGVVVVVAAAAVVVVVVVGETCPDVLGYGGAWGYQWPQVAVALEQ
jgi:hypothetical protein